MVRPQKRQRVSSGRRRRRRRPLNGFMDVISMLRCLSVILKKLLSIINPSYHRRRPVSLIWYKDLAKTVSGEEKNKINPPHVQSSLCQSPAEKKVQNQENTMKKNTSHA